MILNKNGDGENDIPLLAESKLGSTRLFFVPLVRKIDQASRLQMSKRWITVPLKIVVNVWIICAITSLITLILLPAGVFNFALPSKPQRDEWIEANNQIVNALFTLMCLYLHPARFHHLLLLCRWQQEDIVKVREVYCKDGTEKYNERKHMLVVVILLHINCFAQYASCGFTVGYPNTPQRTMRTMPCIFVAIATGVTAGSYIKRSPLGKEYDAVKDLEAQDHLISGTLVS